MTPKKARQVLNAPSGANPDELTRAFRAAVKEVHPDCGGDPIRLRQIIVNLTSNAIKFTDQGEVVVAVALECYDAVSVRLRFAVHDTGIGIPAVRQSHIFESFSQVDSSTTRKYGGTGLGLAICKRLANLMSGQIGVDSQPGRGSTFWFSARFGAPLPAPTAAVPVAPALRGVRILVVDDSVTSRAVLRQHLVGWQAEVHEAATASEALAHHGDLLAVQQSVDRRHHRLELAPGMARCQAPRAGRLQRGHIGRQRVERPQTAPQRQPQGERHDRQQPQSGLDHLLGDVLGQLIALVQLQHHHDLALACGIPLRKGAPGRLLRA